MDRRKSSNEISKKAHKRDRAAYRTGTGQGSSSSSVWQNGQSASPQKCVSASRKGRRLAFDKLCREVLQNVSGEVTDEEAIRRSVGRLDELHCCCHRQVDNLSDLLDGLRATAGHPEFQRLVAILDRRLYPIVRQHFQGDEREVLERRLKELVLLRVLEVPYRTGSKAKELLASLHHVCGGDGLMVWRWNGDEPVYVVEREVEGFVEWLLARTMAFLGRRERDKALSDALWATLSIGKQSVLEETTFEIQMAPFAEGDAVLINHRELGRRVLVFESPWEGERGRRTHRVVRQLPEGMTPDQVWIWLPTVPDPEGDLQITCYMALARALRGAKEGEKGALSTLVGEAYLGASVSALRAIAGCYRRGRVVTDQRTWRPNGHRGDLVSLLKHLITWAMEEKSSADGVSRLRGC